MAGNLTQAEKAEAAVYTMPTVYVGQIVLWHQDAMSAAKPWPFIVCEVGPRTINGYPVGRATEMRVGVRHNGDPQVKDFEMAESGAWSHTQETIDLWGAIMDGDEPKKKKKVAATAE